jgi:hypothetical protein
MQYSHVGYNEINLASRICEGYVYIIIEQGKQICHNEGNN